MDAEVKNLINDIYDLVHNHSQGRGLPKVVKQLYPDGYEIFHLKCAVLELYLSFHNPYALLPAIALIQPCESAIQSGYCDAIFRVFDQLKEKRVDEINPWLQQRLEKVSNHKSFEAVGNFGGLIEILKSLLKIESLGATLLAMQYLDRLVEPKSLYAYNIQMLIDIAHEPVLLQFFGVRNSYVIPRNRVKNEQFLTAMEDLLIRSFVLYDKKAQWNVAFFEKISKHLCGNYDSYLRCIHPQIHRLLSQQVSISAMDPNIQSFQIKHLHSQWYLPNKTIKTLIPQLIQPFKLVRGTQEVPANFHYFPMIRSV